MKYTDDFIVLCVIMVMLCDMSPTQVILGFSAILPVETSWHGKTIHMTHDDVIKWKLFSTLLALCAWNSPATGEFPHKGQWRGALMFPLICALNKRLSKQSWGWWFETLSRPLWPHCNAGPLCKVNGVELCCFWLLLLRDEINGVTGNSRRHDVHVTSL